MVELCCGTCSDDKVSGLNGVHREEWDSDSEVVGRNPSRCGGLTMRVLVLINVLTRPVGWSDDVMEAGGDEGPEVWSMCRSCSIARKIGEAVGICCFLYGFGPVYFGRWRCGSFLIERE